MLLLQFAAIFLMEDVTLLVYTPILIFKKSSHVFWFKKCEQAQRPVPPGYQRDSLSSNWQSLASSQKKNVPTYQDTRLEPCWACVTRLTTFSHARTFDSHTSDLLFCQTLFFFCFWTLNKVNCFKKYEYRRSHSCLALFNFPNLCYMYMTIWSKLPLFSCTTSEAGVTADLVPPRIWSPPDQIRWQIWSPAD